MLEATKIRRHNILLLAEVLTLKQLTEFIINADANTMTCYHIDQYASERGSGVLMDGFIWRSTPQGQVYWAKLYENLAEAES
jgi:hypothetical protein